MYKLEIEIPLADTDSNKVLRGNRFAHSAVRQKVKNHIHFLVRNQLPEKPLESFKISITRYGARSLDWDNLVSSLKPHIDGLVKSGVIKSDSWRYIRQISTDQKTGTERKLVIVVEEL